MNSQELRNLQEAYMEVVMNEGKVGIDDKLPSGKTPRRKMKNKASNLEMDAKIASGVANSPSWRTSRAIRLGAKEQESSLTQRAKKIRQVEKTQKEEADLYDIILSHLLDEGYADTQEAAEAIMVNMSEDWRESICEGYVELNKKRQRRMTDSAMRKMDSDKWEQAYSIENERDTQTPEVSQAKAAANKKRGEEKRRG